MKIKKKSILIQFTAKKCIVQSFQSSRMCLDICTNMFLIIVNYKMNIVVKSGRSLSSELSKSMFVPDAQPIMKFVLNKVPTCS